LSIVVVRPGQVVKLPRGGCVSVVSVERVAVRLEQDVELLRSQPDQVLWCAVVCVCVCDGMCCGVCVCVCVMGCAVVCVCVCVCAFTLGACTPVAAALSCTLVAQWVGRGFGASALPSLHKQQQQQ
jgi:hypothetical protein